MAENITQINRPSPIIEEAQKAYLKSLQDQVETPLDTGAFAPSVVGKTALDQAVAQQAATQAGLGTLTFDPTGAISGVTGTGVAWYPAIVVARHLILFLSQLFPFLATLNTCTQRTEYERGQHT